MKYLIIVSVILLAIAYQSTDATFFRKHRIVLHKQYHFGHGLPHYGYHVLTHPYGQQAGQLEQASTGSSSGGSLRWVSKLLQYITEYKPELLPVLLDIAAKNPGLLQSVAGGLTKRDTSSQVEYNSNDDEGTGAVDRDTNDDSVDPIVLRRMFEYVLDNDSDDCFKKYVCGLTKTALPSDTVTADELMAADPVDDNESVSQRKECQTKFSKCLFKDYKVADVVKHLSRQSNPN